LHLPAPRPTPTALERLAGYLEALQEARIPFDPRLVVRGDWREEGGLIATTQLLEAGRAFTAVFCVNDQTAHGAYLALFR
ncbi:transcriptional regulator, LacI family, partial [mine drainage metagenome]